LIEHKPEDFSRGKGQRRKGENSCFSSSGKEPKGEQGRVAIEDPKRSIEWDRFEAVIERGD